jgi:RNA polymerase sigma-70 factor (ECF subfamily)
MLGRLQSATTTDDELVAKALTGSNRAWLRLIKRYEQRVYNYAARMIGHPDDAKDLTQEVFLGVHRNLPSYRGGGAFPGWLFRIASYRCTDYLRRKRLHLSFDEQKSGLISSSEPHAAAFTTHANRQLSKALQTLPVEQRHVVELKFFQTFTFDEIAEQLGISPNTAKTRLYAALRKLKSHEDLRDAL